MAPAAAPARAPWPTRSDCTSAMDIPTQAPHLARVRRQHPRGRRARQHVRRVGAQRVEGVGVDHHRERQPRRQLVNDGPHAGAGRDPGPKGDRLRARRQRLERGERLRGGGVVAVGVAGGHQLHRLGVQRGLTGRRRGDVTRPAPLRSAARPTRSAAPVLPAEPATTSRCPELPLCASALRRGRRAAIAGASSRNGSAPPQRRASTGDAEVDDLDLPRRRRRVDGQAELPGAHRGRSRRRETRRPPRGRCRRRGPRGCRRRSCAPHAAFIAASAARPRTPRTGP